MGILDGYLHKLKSKKNKKKSNRRMARVESIFKT